MADQMISKTAYWKTPPSESLAFIADTFAPELDRRGWQLSTQTADSMQFSLRYISGWAILGGFLTFPIGILIWVFVRRENTVSMTVAPDGAGTQLIVTGRGSKSTKAYLEAIPGHERPGTQNAPALEEPGREEASMESRTGDVV